MENIVEKGRELAEKQGECWFRTGIVAGIDLVKSLLEEHAEGYVGSDLAKAIEAAFRLSKEKSEQADEELKAMAEKFGLMLEDRKEILN